MRIKVEKASLLSRLQMVLRLACVISLLLLFAAPATSFAQSGLAIWGEIKISSDPTDASAPSAVDVILVRVDAGEVGRQSISNRGRYRFTNLRTGEYEVVIEVDNKEITRVRLMTNGPSPFYGFRQDFEFDWKKSANANPKAEVISAADLYQRSAVNKSLFQKAGSALDKKKYDEAVTLLRQIVDNDKLDFQVWTLLGTIHQVQGKLEDAESAYLSAIQARPEFALALLDLGKLRASQKRFEQAIEPLTRAVEIQPQSADANLLLGEVYLQNKQGSKAVPYLTEAARLGRIEGYLRLGWLYDAAGMKDKAAAEYEALLKKKPDYPERKKLEQYILTNKQTTKRS